MGEEQPRHGGLGSLAAGMREAYESGRTRELEWRPAQLRGLIRLLTEEEEVVFNALRDDLGKHRAESFRDEVGPLVKSVNHTLQNLKQWVTPEKVKKTEDSIAFLKGKPKPLAIYAFTTDEKLKQRIIADTSSGSVTINDAIVQYGLDSVPFGGVGECGFGQYHGKYSFELFSHRKAMLKRGLLIEFGFRYPPWDEYKIGMLRRVFRFDYVSLVLALLGLRR